MRTRALAIFLILLACFGAVAAAQETATVTHLADPHGGRKPLNTVVPIYPEKARRQRLEGEVEVCFHIDREGQTSRVRVRSSTDRIFEKPSILAARASTFMTLAPGERVAAIKTCRTFRFRLLPVAIEPAA